MLKRTKCKNCSSDFQYVAARRLRQVALILYTSKSFHSRFVWRDFIQHKLTMDDVLRDIIEVKNLRVSAFLGVNEGERVTKQRLVITLSLSTDLRSTASQDSLATTFNYSHVTKVVTTFVERSAYFTLEALTEAIARVLIVELGVPRANVRVEKPEALG